MLRILEDAETKLKAWYKYYANAGNPDSPYRCILKARGSDNSNVDANGHVTEQTLQLIKEVLIKYFGMAYQVDDTFPQKLSKKLQDAKVKAILIKIRNLTICEIDLESLKPDTAVLYDKLSAPGPDGLSFKGDRFCVGATKTMNFLFPELFVMLDSVVAKALFPELFDKYDAVASYNNFQYYWKALKLCYGELKEWCNTFGSVDSLIALDVPPTTPIRVFDKCATVMGHPELKKIYEVLQRRKAC